MKDTSVSLWYPVYVVIVFHLVKQNAKPLGFLCVMEQNGINNIKVFKSKTNHRHCFHHLYLSIKTGYSRRGIKGQSKKIWSLFSKIHKLEGLPQICNQLFQHRGPRILIGKGIAKENK